MELLKELDHLCMPLKDIELATKNFTTLIGKGGYGNVYKGELSVSGKLTTVAVKRLDTIASGQGHKEFLTEIHMLSRFKHSNLVSLLGFCHEGTERILVYEHAEHGSLDKYISTNTTLTCKQKIKICIDAACGLRYLHNHVAENQRVIHRDIKSANILLDNNWKAMISDLGLSKMGRSNENDTFLITDPCGTLGYMDPVYRETGVLTKESDVYSLGVVLFEVLCGRLCFMNVNDERRFLASLVQHYYQKGKLHEIIDPVIKEDLPSGSLNMISEIAYQCLHNDRNERPSVGLVIKKLEEALEVLDMNAVVGTDVFGLNDDIKSLVSRLTCQTEMFIAIVGEGGSGKTTLARAVYKHRKTKDHFEFQTWISVTEVYTAERIKPIILKCMGKRYLIVVDGVESYGFLHDLKDSFRDEKNGSKVILTSRSIPEKMKQNLHIMNKLTDEESWKMFLYKAGKENKVDQIIRFKHKILTICKGSPQNIVLMAGLLSNNRIKRWSTVIDDGQCPDDVLRICYNDLKIHLKLCLLYLSLFPKDHDISARRLLRIWLAEGFVRRKHKDRSPEDLAQKCFTELVGRNMIQITKIRSDNSPKECRLVSVFHEFLLPKAEDVGLFSIQHKSENNESKVIFTSRKLPETVAPNPHIMNRLNEDKSWKMFLNKAGREKEADRITLSLKHRILGICNGLPENIVLMAGLLLNIEIGRWSMLIRDMTAHSMLSLFHDLGLLSEHYNISVRQLLPLWQANGFVKRGHTDWLRSDNSPKLCGLVSLFQDYMMQSSLGITSFQEPENNLCYPYTCLHLDELGKTTSIYLSISPNNFFALETPDLKLTIKNHLPNSTLLLNQLNDYLHLNINRLPIAPDIYILLTSLPKLQPLRFLDRIKICLPNPPNDLSYLKTIYFFWMLKQLNLNNIRVTMPLSSCLTVATVKGLFLVDKIPINEFEGVLMLINLKESGIQFQLTTRLQDALLDLIKKQLFSQPTMRK